MSASKMKVNGKHLDTQTQDHKAGTRDAKAGVYDKWYRYNRKDDGAAYDAGYKEAMATGKMPEQQVIECVESQKINGKPYIGSWIIRGNKICAKRNRPYGVNVTLATVKPIPSYGTPEEGNANLQLIAAAPDLLDAITSILFQVCQGKVLERDACIAQARAAIKKARGAA